MSISNRQREQSTLNTILTSNKPEFLAIYGRRRVGKTFLIREFFETKKVTFLRCTGSKKSPMKEQIAHVLDNISKVFYHNAPLQQTANWDDTFKLLTNTIENQQDKQPVVIFLDELPWMATARSRLLENLDYYWNQHWSSNPRIKLIVCGSSASWIINKIINNKGGLHNRITRKILLEPLNLAETKQYLKNQKIHLNHRQITEIYMLTGGVPLYLSEIKKGFSAAQNIDQLAFSKQGLLFDEFDNLFSSLFNNYEICIDIIRLIASKPYGIGQEELFKSMQKNIKGKTGINKLKEMEDAGFIIGFTPFQSRKKGIYYRVIDEYTLFYLRWIEPLKPSLLKRKLPTGYWAKQQNTPSWYSWTDLAFEAVCYKHINEIAAALKLSPTAIPYGWRYKPKKETIEQGAQIDLLFDRDDNSITLCEIKFTNSPLKIDKKLAENLIRKKSVFKKQTRTHKQLFIALVSANGVCENSYAEDLIDNMVILEDLFKKI